MKCDDNEFCKDGEAEDAEDGVDEEENEDRKTADCCYRKGD